MRPSLEMCPDVAGLRTSLTELIRRVNANAGHLPAGAVVDIRDMGDRLAQMLVPVAVTENVTLPPGAAVWATGGTVIFEGDAGVLLADAACVVIPSLYEPFGIVALEGMAAGAPTIVARTGGLAEIVGGTEAGMLFTPGDPHELADRIEQHAGGSRRDRTGRGVHTHPALHPHRNAEVSGRVLAVGQEGVVGRQAPHRAQYLRRRTHSEKGKGRERKADVLARAWRAGRRVPAAPFVGYLCSIWVWSVYSAADPLLAYAIGGRIGVELFLAALAALGFTEIGRAHV